MSIKAYKGFNKDMTCRGFQFKEGETYEEERAEICKTGFHACERPLDVFEYYEPAKSVYHEVELEDVDKKRDGNDSKVCAKKIKVGASIDVKGLIKAQFEYVKSHCTNEDTDPKKANAGDRGAANAGYRGAANAGYCGAANAGNWGAANAGDWGAANAGDWGAANAGYCGAANAGNRGAANAGNRGAANAGDRGAANAGDWGAANAGDWGAANAGDRGAANAGDWGAANAGDRGAANAGDWGAAISRGYAEVGKGGVAIARGDGDLVNKVRGKMGAILVIALEKEDSPEIKNWKAGVVDGVNLKPDVWYKLENGEFVEAEDGGE